MSVLVAPRTPTYHPPFSPRQHPPLPIITMRSINVQTNDCPPPLLPKPKQKNRKEDKKKKKSRPKRSKSCPPIDGDRDDAKKKKYKFPYVEDKSNTTNSTPTKLKDTSTGNMAVVGRNKSGGKSNSAPGVSRDRDVYLSQNFKPLPPPPPPPPPKARVRFITLAKLKEEDMRDKLRQTVFKLSSRSKSMDAGSLIVVDSDTTCSSGNKKVECYSAKPVLAQGKSITNNKPVIKTTEVISVDDQPVNILKHKRFAFTKQTSLEEPIDKTRTGQSGVKENGVKRRYSSGRLKRQSSIEPVDTPQVTDTTLSRPVWNSNLSNTTNSTNYPFKKPPPVPSDIQYKNTITKTTPELPSSTTRKHSPTNITTQKPGSTSLSQKASTLQPPATRSRASNPSPSNSSTSNSEKNSNNSDKSPSKSKKSCMPLLSKIKPMNQESEKDKFFRSNFHDNPKFVYRNAPTQAEMERFSQASGSLLHIAIKIMRVAIKKYGTYEKFEEKTGGPRLSRSQIAEAAHAYLKNEDLEDEVTLMLSDDLCSRACMSRVNGRPTLLVKTNCMRQNWVEGMLRHEIGTHYLRSTNNKLQVWSSGRKRKELEMLPTNPTEEGLASLHSVIFREDPNLWRSAFLYYIIYQASRMSFAELFHDAGQFVKDPHVRWDYCLRAKRGMEDTAQPGAFCKDQVYLKGALQILKHRRRIDFHMLIKAGKVDFRDLEKYKYVVDTEKTRIPSFMQDIYIYRVKLEEIFLRNKLTDSELEHIEELN